MNDALIVIHKGEIYYERYTNSTLEMQPHLQHSMTKSYVGIVAAMLAAEGIFDPEKTVSYYLPELADSNNADVVRYGKEKDNSHYDEMTVRNLMDMSSSTSYKENPHSFSLEPVALAYNTSPDPENLWFKNGGIGYRNMPLLYGRRSDNEPQGTRFEYKSMDT